eukprot:GGOE01040442.1.p1 GENE.GGOE01040442.1~~GGOE01040442.1.p1  ORF type:complete len:435 (-),score=55.84 GGOE01040442.1:380-1612(-)
MAGRARWRPERCGETTGTDDWLGQSDVRRGRPRRSRTTLQSLKQQLEEEEGEAECWPEEKAEVADVSAAEGSHNQASFTSTLRSPVPSPDRATQRTPVRSLDLQDAAAVQAVDIPLPEAFPAMEVQSGSPVDQTITGVANGQAILPPSAADSLPDVSPSPSPLPNGFLVPRDNEACFAPPVTTSASPPPPPLALHTPPAERPAPLGTVPPPTSPASTAQTRPQKTSKAAKLRKQARALAERECKLGALQALQEQVMGLHSLPLAVPDPSADPWLKPMSDQEYLSFLPTLPPQPFVPPLPTVQMSPLPMPIHGLPMEPHQMLHQYLLQQQQQMALYEAQQQQQLLQAGLLPLPSPQNWGHLFTAPPQPTLLPPHMQMLLLDQQPLQEQKRVPPPPVHGPPVAMSPNPAELA